MKRIDRFESFAQDPGQEKLFKTLSEDEREACRAFIREHDHLSLNDFAAATNRWMLDCPKPKRFPFMWALVSQTNPATMRRRRE